MTRPIGGPNNHNIDFIIPFPSCPYMVHTKYDQAIDYDDRLSNNVFYKYTKHEKNLQIPAPDFIYHSFFPVLQVITQWAGIQKTNYTEWTKKIKQIKPGTYL